MVEGISVILNDNDTKLIFALRCAEIWQERHQPRNFDLPRAVVNGFSIYNCKKKNSATLLPESSFADRDVLPKSLGIGLLMEDMQRLDHALNSKERSTTRFTSRSNFGLKMAYEDSKSRGLSRTQFPGSTKVPSKRTTTTFEIPSELRLRDLEARNTGSVMSLDADSKLPRGATIPRLKKHKKKKKLSKPRIGHKAPRVPPRLSFQPSFGRKSRGESKARFLLPKPKVKVKKEKHKKVETIDLTQEEEMEEEEAKEIFVKEEVQELSSFAGIFTPPVKIAAKKKLMPGIIKAITKERDENGKRIFEKLPTIKNGDANNKIPSGVFEIDLEKAMDHHIGEGSFNHVYLIDLDDEKFVLKIPKKSDSQVDVEISVQDNSQRCTKAFNLRLGESGDELCRLWNVKVLNIFKLELHSPFTFHAFEKKNRGKSWVRTTRIGKVEPYIDPESPIFGPWMKTINNNGDIFKECGIITEVSECFTHYSYMHFKQKLIITDCQGWTAYEQNGHRTIILNDPEWLSHKSKFFNRRLRNFFTKHQCNRFCSAVGLEIVDMKNPRKKLKC